MNREQALSEVIGFLMIVALLGILFSMYLLYVVPIQGRDAEIAHMKYITQEFISLKADIDGLIINDKINLPIARSFELGTLSSVGAGSFSIMPMSSYIEASGTLMVNEQNDFLEVAVNGQMSQLSNDVFATAGNSNYTRYYAQKNLNFYPYLIQFSCTNPESCPPAPINFTTTDERFYNVTAKKRPREKEVFVTINMSNITFTPAQENVPTGIDATATITYPNKQDIYDIVLEIWDNRTYPNRQWISERTLAENITIDQTEGTNFTINILNDIITNNSTQFYESYISHASFLQSESYQPYVITNKKTNYYPPRIGSLQYESANRYWVDQNLLYEMGGLFLNQPSDLGSSVMLVPSIAVTPINNITSGNYDLKVSVNNIRITDTEDISGSVSAQIFSKVDQIYHNLFTATTVFSDFGSKPAGGTAAYYKLKDTNEPNAYAIWLQYIPDDPRVKTSDLPLSGTLTPEEQNRMITSTELWKRGFDQIKTITNKTISDNPDIGGFSGYIYSFRIEDKTNGYYSANLIIGEKASQTLAGVDNCPPLTSDSTKCLPKVREYMSTICRTDKPFILDYTESEVSLVMQSGAL